MTDNVLQRESSWKPVGGITFRENEELKATKEQQYVVKEFSTPLGKPSTSKSFEAISATYCHNTREITADNVEAKKGH